MRALMLLVAAAAMAPAYAQTYKWLDERGVVNYSNVRPPARPVAVTPIEDRVSVVPRDPNFAAAAAAAQAQSARQAEIAHQEWLARQQGMLQAQALAVMYSQPVDYAPAYYPYAYGVPLVATRVVRGPLRRGPVHPSRHRF